MLLPALQRAVGAVNWVCLSPCVLYLFKVAMSVAATTGAAAAATTTTIATTKTVL